MKLNKKMDYINEWSDIMALKNFLNIDILKKKENYSYSENDILNHVKFGIIRVSNFKEMNKSDEKVLKLLNTKIIFKKKKKLIKIRKFYKNHNL